MTRRASGVAAACVVGMFLLPAFAWSYPLKCRSTFEQYKRCGCSVSCSTPCLLDGPPDGELWSTCGEVADCIGSPYCTGGSAGATFTIDGSSSSIPWNGTSDNECIDGLDREGGVMTITIESVYADLFDR